MPRRALTVSLVLGLLSLLLSASPPASAAPPDQIARLGQDLTPVGAERAGNAAGTIPAWTGGMTAPPPGWAPGKPMIDPFAGEAPLYTVTPQNAGQYAAILPAGQAAMLKIYPDYKVPVYPSHRTCAYTKNVYDHARENAAIGALTPDGNGLLAGTVAWPFPLASTGIEMFWNHRFRPRGGYKVRRNFAMASVTRGGDYTLIKTRDEAIIHYMGPGLKRAGDVKDLAGLNNFWVSYIAVTTSPARLAGQVVLVYDNINDGQGSRQAWIYNPGTRRLLRAPDLAFDNPGINADGLSVADQFDVMNGSPERYSFKALGKQEMLIGYNAYRAMTVPYAELLKPSHVNQDVMRYELHRVHMVEANLKEGARHIYSRRVFLQDEDSWNFAAVNLYDSRGELFRYQEAPIVNYYGVPVCGQGFETHNDLPSGRYLAITMTNEEAQIDWAADDLEPDHFSPDAVRRMGARQQ